ncbi:hypothetical protein [Fusobacterium canifelinum]
MSDFIKRPVENNKNNNKNYITSFWSPILIDDLSLALLYSQQSPVSSSVPKTTYNTAYIVKPKKKIAEKKIDNENNINTVESFLSKLEKIKKERSKYLYPLKPDKRKIEDILYIKNKKIKYGEVCFTLSAGSYTVGMDIPEGRYRIVAKKNSGNIYNKYNTFDENLDAENANTQKIFARLFIGDILTITYSLVVELSSEKANLLQNIVRRPIGKEITLKAGNYICGEDFKSGVYNIQRIKNSGFVSFDDSGESFGSKDNELKEIKNCLFKNNDYLGISGGLVIKLVPSQNNYIK